MGDLHANLNRPIHLARRDASFERALEFLSQPFDRMPATRRLRNVSRILSLLHTARKHAFFAIRSKRAANAEKDFLRFLDLKLDNVQSADAMIQHQIHLEEEKSFLSQFLGLQPDQSGLPALHYQRRAEDIIAGLWHMIQIAQPRFHRLRTANIDALEEPERARYDKAYSSFRKDVLDRYPIQMPEEDNA